MKSNKWEGGSSPRWAAARVGPTGRGGWGSRGRCVGPEVGSPGSGHPCGRVMVSAENNRKKIISSLSDGPAGVHQPR